MKSLSLVSVEDNEYSCSAPSNEVTSYNEEEVTNDGLNEAYLWHDVIQAMVNPLRQ